MDAAARIVRAMNPPGCDTDEAELGRLMCCAQEGDQNAYALLLSRVAVIARDFARREMADPSGSEDVAQDVLITIHQARHTYDPARSFAAWMFAIIRHRLVDHMRKVRRIRSREVTDETVLDAAAAQENDDATDLLGDEIREALARLPESQRRVIELLKLESLGVAETARRLGLSESNVKVTAHRGYAQLRKLLGRNRP